MEVQNGRPSRQYVNLIKERTTREGLTAELITPALDLTSAPTTLRFYTMVTPGSDGLHIDVSSDNGTSWTEDALIISNSPGESTWTEHTLDLSAYSTSTQVKLRFRAASTWGSGKCSIALDNVQLYEPAPMEVGSVECVQASTELVATGSANNEMLKINVPTTGLLDAKTVTQFSLSTQGSTDAADISRAAIYYTAGANSFNDAVLFSETNAPNGAFSLAGTQTLTEGNNFFWLVYDIAVDATTDNVVDASIDIIDIGSDQYTIANGNPEGNRTIERIYELKSGTNEVIVGEDPMPFYDDGGIDNNYSKSFEGTVTFVPQTDGQRVRLELHALELSWAEDFMVYNGDFPIEENLIADLDDGNNISEGQDLLIIKSTSADGKLTVHFESGSFGGAMAGWEAMVYSFTPQPYAFQSASAGQGSATALRNESDVEILRIPVEFSGETTAALVNSFTFHTSGSTDVSDIASAQVYYTAREDVFSEISAAAFGTPQSSPSGEFVISGEQEVAHEGKAYFWLMYNVSASAAVDNVLDATLSSIRVNEVDYAVADGNPDGNAVISAGLSGNFTIGLGANDNYASFADAFADIASQGIEGPVTVSVKDGTYEERPELPHIKGTSETNTVTFVGENSDAANVILMSDAFPSKGDAILTVSGAHYVTFSDITFKTSQKQYEALVMLSGQSRHVTFDACVFDAPIELGSNYSNISVAGIKNDAENEANQNNDYLTVKNSHFIGGSIGAYIGGTGYVRLPKEVGAQLIDNTFEKQFSKGIYLHDEKDALVSGNHIHNNTSNYSSFNAIDAFRLIGSSVVANNTIHLERSKNSNGIHFRPVAGTVESPARIYNNIILFSQTPGSSYGILIDDGCANAHFYYNTVVMQGDESMGSSAIYVDGRSNEVPENVDIKNNLFIHNANGLAVRIKYPDYFSGLDFDHNNLYSTGTNLAQIGFSESLVEVADLAAWQTHATAANSISEAVEFVSSTDMHLKAAGNLNSALPIDYITLDIDGEARSSSTPTMGADEFSENTAAPVFNEGFPKASSITHNAATIEVSVDKTGSAWWIVLPEVADVPSQAQVKAGTDANGTVLADNVKGTFSFNANTLVRQSIEALDANTAYFVYVAIEDNQGVPGSSLASLGFTTDFKPTEVATFENVEATGSEPFEDGTALFTNVTVSEGEGVKGSARFGSISEGEGATASIVLTNTMEGLPIEGFFYRSGGSFTLNGTIADNTLTEDVEVMASDTWAYADLSFMGNITGVEIEASTSAVSIDNFGDVPMELQIVSLDDQSIARGESATLEATISGGVAPYSYVWSSSETIDDNSVPVLIVAPESTNEYQLTVSDARGSTATGKVLVSVSGDIAQTATFEGLLSAPETYWMGDPEQSASFFYSGSFRFNNSYFPDWLTWGAIGYSNETSTDFDPSAFTEQQFRSSAGSGANGSETYGVVYAFGNQPEAVLTNTTEGEVLSGFYITNTAWAASSMEDGDAFAGDPFAAGDWFKVIVEGYDKDGALTGTVDGYLADYRSEDASEHYILKEWKWVSMSSLGAVQKLRFKVDGSRKGDYGLNTPGYFCMDDLNGEDNATSIGREIHPNGDIQLYPNPAQNVVYIDLSLADDAERIEIYDFSGKLIQAQKIHAQSTVPIDVSKLNSGMYIVRVVGNGKTSSHKLQKL